MYSYLIITLVKPFFGKYKRFPASENKLFNKVWKPGTFDNYKNNNNNNTYIRQKQVLSSYIYWSKNIPYQNWLQTKTCNYDRYGQIDYSILQQTHDFILITFLTNKQKGKIKNMPVNKIVNRNQGIKPYFASINTLKLFSTS